MLASYLGTVWPYFENLVFTMKTFEPNTRIYCPDVLSDSDLWCWKRFLLKEMLKPHLTIDGDIQQGLFKHWCRRIAKSILPMFFQRQFFSKTSYDWIPENSSPPWALYDFFCHFESSFTLQPFNPLTQPFCCTNVSLVLWSL